MWKSNERVPGSWLSHLSSQGRNCGTWQLLHFPPSRSNGAGKVKNFVGSSHGKLRCFLLILTQTVKPGRNNGVLLSTITTLWFVFRMKPYWIYFLRRIVSLSYQLEGKKKQYSPGGFRTCTAHWGHQFSQSLIENGNCYWTRTGRIFRSTSSKGWIPFHC